MNRKHVWATVSIANMWLAVLFVGVFEPELAVNSAGGDIVRVPAARMFVALFAAVANGICGLFALSGVAVRPERPCGPFILLGCAALAHPERDWGPAATLKGPAPPG